jgi:type 1 fimbriae regulatory protein FimB/type 1 fimbriae regulatory protein FimE
MGQVVDLPKRRRKAPATENGKVAPPRRRPNRELRSREHLIPTEVEQLITAVGASGRHQGRDRTLLTLMYRHGLRVSEAVSLRWDQVDLKAGLLHVNRLKNGVPSTHPLRGPELRLLRQLRRDSPEGPYGSFFSGCENTGEKPAHHQHE